MARIVSYDFEENDGIPEATCAGIIITDEYVLTHYDCCTSYGRYVIIDHQS